jgi:SecD/SecF fusion protein
MLDHVFSVLLAATGEPAVTQSVWFPLALFFIATIPTYMLGIGLARSLRMPEYGSKIGFVFVTIGLGIVICMFGTPKFGIDLRGGVILVYQIDEQATEASNAGALQAEGGGIDSSELVAALNNRLNPGGVNEIQIRQYGEREVEIIVPDVSEEEKEAIKRKVAKAGQLEFLILANDPTRDDVINAVLNDPALKRERYIRNAKGELIGRWVRVNWDTNPKTKQQELAVNYPDGYYRDATTGERIDSTLIQSGYDALQKQGITDVEALMVSYPDSNMRVTGGDLANAMTSTDEVGNYIVRFAMNQAGAAKMGNLTGANT